MGRIYAICGPSGVGKTTFIRKYFETNPKNIKIISRTTTRDRRLGESNQHEYEFTDIEGFLRILFANEFIDFIEYDGHPYGIRLGPLEDIIHSPEDGIIMAGTAGAVNIKRRYKESVSIIYLYPGSKDEFQHPDSLNPKSDANLELIERLKIKINEGVLSPKDEINRYLTHRMSRSFLGIAFMNGQRENGFINIMIKQTTQTNQLKVFISQKSLGNNQYQMFMQE